MPTQIVSDNLELTSSMQVLAELKLKPLLAHIAQRSRKEATVRVVMNKADNKDKFLVKIEAEVEGKVYFGCEEDFVLESALINGINEVEKQYLKDKEKTKDRDYGKNRDLKRFDDSSGA